MTNIFKELNKTIKRYDTKQNRIVLDWSITGALALVIIVALLLAGC